MHEHQNLPSFPQEHALAQSLKTPYAREAYEKLNLGQQIKRFRKKSNLTQLALAKKLKTSQSVIARMETGKQNLTIGTLVHISILLGCKLKVHLAP